MLINIAPVTISNWTATTVAPLFYVRAQQSFVAFDGTIIQAQSQLFTAPTSLFGTTLQIGAIQLQSTRDAKDHPDAHYEAYFIEPVTEKYIPFEGLTSFFLDHNRGPNQTWAQIIIYNRVRPRPRWNPSIPTWWEMVHYIENIIGSDVPPATIFSMGKVRLSTPAADPSSPVVVTDTDPRNYNPRVPTGPAGGALTGFYPNPQLAEDYVTEPEMTSAIATAIAGLVPITRQIIAGAGLVGGGPLSANVTLALSTTGVTPGTYTQVTVDEYGRVLSGSNSGGGGGGGGGGGSLGSQLALIVQDTPSVDLQAGTGPDFLRAHVRRKTVGLSPTSEGEILETGDGLCVRLGLGSGQAAPGITVADILNQLGVRVEGTGGSPFYNQRKILRFPGATLTPFGTDGITIEVGGGGGGGGGSGVTVEGPGGTPSLTGRLVVRFEGCTVATLGSNGAVVTPINQGVTVQGSGGSPSHANRTILRFPGATINTFGSNGVEVSIAGSGMTVQGPGGAPSFTGRVLMRFANATVSALGSDGVEINVTGGGGSGIIVQGFDGWPSYSNITTLRFVLSDLTLLGSNTVQVRPWIIVQGPGGSPSISGVSYLRFNNATVAALGTDGAQVTFSGGGGGSSGITIQRLDTNQNYPNTQTVRVEFVEIEELEPNLVLFKPFVRVSNGIMPAAIDSRRLFFVNRRITSSGDLAFVHWPWPDESLYARDELPFHSSAWLPHTSDPSVVTTSSSVILSANPSVAFNGHAYKRQLNIVEANFLRGSIALFPELYQGGSSGDKSCIFWGFTQNDSPNPTCYGVRICCGGDGSGFITNQIISACTMSISSNGDFSLVSTFQNYYRQPYGPIWLRVVVRDASTYNVLYSLTGTGGSWFYIAQDVPWSSGGPLNSVYFFIGVAHGDAAAYNLPNRAHLLGVNFDYSSGSDQF